MLSMFVGMLASICWIFVILLFPSFFSSQGQIMPFEPWIMVAAGLVGAVASFFLAMGIVRGIARLLHGSGKKRTRW